MSPSESYGYRNASEPVSLHDVLVNMTHKLDQVADQLRRLAQIPPVADRTSDFR